MVKEGLLSFWFSLIGISISTYFWIFAIQHRDYYVICENKLF